MKRVYRKLSKDGYFSDSYWGVLSRPDGSYFEIDLHVYHEKTAYAELRRIQHELDIKELQRGSKLITLISDYFSNLVSIGSSLHYCKQVRSHLLKVSSAQGWIRIKDVTIQGFERWRSSSVFSPNTKNRYLASFSSFFQWAFIRGYVESNIFRRVQKIRNADNSVYVRRSLTPEEIGRLLSVSPPERSIVYFFVLNTGLRRGEVFNLRWSDLDLPRSSMVVRASISKSRKTVVLPLSSVLVQRLLVWKSETFVSEDSFVFRSVGNHWRSDFDHASILRSSGRFKCDFHSLRKTFCTMLAMNGVSPRVCQELARHSNYNLTSKVYTDVSRLDLRGAVDTLDFSDTFPSTDSM